MALVGVRHFEFRVPPRPNNRAGRYKIGATPLLTGVPVRVKPDSNIDAQGRLELELVTGNIGKPQAGIHGIMNYEPAYDYAYDGRDRNLTTPSDLDTAPAHEPVQLVNGDDVKVCLRNTEDNVRLGRAYAGIVFVAGAGATPTVKVGDFLGPGVGNADDGFWAETNEANAWLVVTAVDTIRGEVEARQLF